MSSFSFLKTTLVEDIRVKPISKENRSSLSAIEDMRVASTASLHEEEKSKQQLSTENHKVPKTNSANRLVENENSIGEVAAKTFQRENMQKFATISHLETTETSFKGKFQERARITNTKYLNKQQVQSLASEQMRQM